MDHTNIKYKTKKKLNKDYPPLMKQHIPTMSDDAQGHLLDTWWQPDKNLAPNYK